MFCFYCFYDIIFIFFFDNTVYCLENNTTDTNTTDTKTTDTKTTDNKVKKKKVRSWQSGKVKLKKLPKVKNFVFPGASATFQYYLALINSNFQLLTSIKEINSTLSVVELKKKVYNDTSTSTSTVLERYRAPIKRWQDRHARGDRVAKAMEAAIQHWIINYKDFYIPFNNILDTSNIFGFDKWLYWDYNGLVRIDNFFKPKSEKDFSDFVLICQFMERYNSRYNINREELDYLLAFKTHYSTHCVKWNFMEWLLCLESYKNNLELLDRSGLLENMSNIKDVTNIEKLKELINLENIKNMDNLDAIINVDNNTSVINSTKRIPLLLMFDLDMRLAYVKHSVTMQNSYYGALKVFTYEDNKFDMFLNVKKKFDDKVLIANIIEGFALLEHFKPLLTTSDIGMCWVFGLSNYDWPLHQYVRVVFDSDFKYLPISILESHLKYDDAFRFTYKKMVKRKNVPYLNLWLIDVLHHFFYANWSCKDFLNALLVQKAFPNSLQVLNIIKNNELNFSFEQLLDVYKLHCKYNKIWYLEWWSYFTGRKYSIPQLIQFYKLLQTSEWANKEAELLTYLKKNDKLFLSYINMEDTTFHRKMEKRWVK